MTDPEAFLRAIVEYPHDLRPRLVFADWLDENVTETNGFAERAEFIRLQIDGEDECRQGEYRRRLLPDGLLTMYCTPKCDHRVLPSDVIGVLVNGFVQEVRCPLGWWVGGECECFTNEPDAHCPACHGTGRTPANGPAVVSRQPVTRVDVQEAPGEEVLLWDRSNEGEEEEWVLAGRYYGQPCPHDVWMEFSDPDKGWPYPTREAAVEALSRVLVDWARKQAGLPPIKWEVSQ